MSGAEPANRIRQPQRLASMAAALVVLAAIASGTLSSAGFVTRSPLER